MIFTVPEKGTAIDGYIYINDFGAFLRVGKVMNTGGGIIPGDFFRGVGFDFRIKKQIIGSPGSLGTYQIEVNR